MTRLDAAAEPAVMESAAERAHAAGGSARRGSGEWRGRGDDGPRTIILEARQVPLGGVRAMDVRRSLPQRDLPLIGAWCFLDRFGPQEAMMRVDPHPHIGLQTVTWPFVGEVRHRDTLSNDVLIGRGQLNLMTAGNGIAHSEYSTGDGPIPLDALQLWVALPESRRHGGPAFEQHTDLPSVDLGHGAHATVVLGEFAGVASPASVYTPIAGAEVHVPAGATVTLPLRPDWEYGIVGCFGEITAADTAVQPDQLLYLGIHRDEVQVSCGDDATFFVLGGEPFEDDIVMWWNFVGRTHEEVVEAREAWEARSTRFGEVPGHDTRIPAPEMPHVRLARRHRRI